MYFRGREPARLVGAPAGHELAQDEGPQRSNLRRHLPLAHHPKPWNDDLLDELFDEFFGKQFRKCRLKFADFELIFYKNSGNLQPHCISLPTPRNSVKVRQIGKFSAKFKELPEISANC